MTLSSLFLTAKFEFVIISRHLVVKKGSQKSSVPKEFIQIIFYNLGLTTGYLVQSSWLPKFVPGYLGVVPGYCSLVLGYLVAEVVGVGKVTRAV